MQTGLLLDPPAAAPRRRVKPARPELGQDLRAWVGDRGLVELAAHAAQAGTPGIENAGGARPGGLAPRMMLTLLTYCYAANICASRDVELACYHDAQARHICASHYPSSEAIRRFRRAHRQEVAQCLGRALVEVWRRRPAGTEARPEPGLAREAPLQLRIQELIEHRLDLAALLDMVAAE